MKTKDQETRLFSLDLLRGLDMMFLTVVGPLSVRKSLKGRA